MRWRHLAWLGMPKSWQTAIQVICLPILRVLARNLWPQYEATICLERFCSEVSATPEFYGTSSLGLQSVLLLLLPNRATSSSL